MRILNPLLIWKLFRALMIVATWSNAALKDGRITVPEGLALLTRLAVLFGLPTEINLLTIHNFLETDRQFTAHKNQEVNR